MFWYCLSSSTDGFDGCRALNEARCWLLFTCCWTSLKFWTERERVAGGGSCCCCCWWWSGGASRLVGLVGSIPVLYTSCWGMAMRCGCWGKCCADIVLWLAITRAWECCWGGYIISAAPVGAGGCCWNAPEASWTSLCKAGTDLELALRREVIWRWCMAPGAPAEDAISAARLGLLFELIRLAAPTLVAGRSQSTSLSWKCNCCCWWCCCCWCCCCCGSCCWFEAPGVLLSLFNESVERETVDVGEGWLNSVANPWNIAAYQIQLKFILIIFLTCYWGDNW